MRFAGRVCSTNSWRSLGSGQSPGVLANRHLAFAVPRYSGKGCFGLGIPARVRDCKLFCGRTHGDRVLRLGMQCADQPAYSEAERGLLLGGEDLRQARVDVDWSWADDQAVPSLPNAWYVFVPCDSHTLVRPTNHLQASTKPLLPTSRPATEDLTSHFSRRRTALPSFKAM